MLTLIDLILLISSSNDFLGSFLGRTIPLALGLNKLCYFISPFRQKISTLYAFLCLYKKEHKKY